MIGGEYKGGNVKNEIELKDSVPNKLAFISRIH